MLQKKEIQTPAKPTREVEEHKLIQEIDELEHTFVGI